MAAFSKSESERAVSLFLTLGYPLEASEVIRKRILQLGQLVKASDQYAEVIRLLEESITQIESVLQNRLDLESQHALVSHYQALAYTWMSMGLAREGLSVLKKTESILKKHDLVEKRALNELYQGCLFLEMCDDQENDEFCHEAMNHFSEAQQLFKIINNYEGSWRSQFGIALSSHKRITLKAKSAPLHIQNCADHYMRSIDAVHYMTINHLKTGRRFGESFVFSTRLQKGADQLYASAIDFFVNIANSQPVAKSLQDQKRLWTMLNKSNPEVKMN